MKRNQQDFRTEKYIRYGIRKYSFGAASVAIAAGLMFLGTGAVAAAETQSEQKTDTALVAPAHPANQLDSEKEEVSPVSDDTHAPVDKEAVTGTASIKEDKKQTVTPATEESIKPQEAEKREDVKPSTAQEVETKEDAKTEVSHSIENKDVKETSLKSEENPSLNLSSLKEKLAGLESQIERIQGNAKQAAHISNAEKLASEAKRFLESLDTTQQEVDAKAKEISSLTSILKSIKAEETVKENKNQDSRNGKKMEEGTGFREGGAAGTGVGADVVDATSTPAATRDGYTDRAAAESFTKQVTWLDFGDTGNWQNVDNEGGKIYLKEGSIYSKEVIPGYVINIKVKSLKPFQATEIYRKRMEAANASEEEKATFNPNATNQHFGDKSGPTRITANQQDGTWSEIRNNGINTGNKKTAIGSESDWSNVGVQFEISATYKGKNVRPAVVMNDSESANHGENIILTTNGSPWERVLELKKERFVGGTFTPTPYKPINNYNLRHEDYPQSGGRNNAAQLLWHLREGLLTFADGRKLAPKYFTNPDQETGGLGTGVFGPVTSSGGYSLPVLMTKDATEVGLYILSSGIQTAMMGVIPIDEGDAPESYGKASHMMNTTDGLTGAEVKQPYLGSTRPDMDTGTTKDWYGDDKDLDGDEGVNQLLPENLKGSEGNIIKANISNAGHYTLNVQAHTGGAEKAYIRSWIDFNKNGQFDADEASEIATVTQDGTVKLNFKNKISTDAETLLEAGARVRIATVESEIENPTGTAFSGEVEDFIAKITHPPKGEKKTTIGNIKETQREEIQFTAQGRNVYLEDHSYAEIDTTVQPTYIDNKTGQEVTLASDGTYTVEGEGTYKFTISDNRKDVKVEFTPADGFVGKAHGISIRRQDTNKTTTDWGTPDAATLPNVNDSLNTMDGLYIPEVTVPTSVEATPINAESQNIQGLPQKGKPTFTVETSPTPVTASAKYPAKLVDPRTNTVTELTTVDAFEQGTTNKIGTYTIVPETGEVTFTPNKDFQGVPAPATISADVELTHDKDGNVTTKTLTATYTPTIIPVTPTAEPSRTSGILGKPQTSRIVLDTEETGDDKGKTVNFNKGTEKGPKEERVELNPDTLTLLDGENEVTSVTTTDGKYELDKANKTITFTPNATFTGVAKPVSVRIKDANGTKVDTTYTPTVTDVTMEGTPKETEAPQGQTQTGTPEFTVSSPDVRITGYKLINPTTNTPVDDEEIDVPNQGTYRIDKTTGTVKFIPKAGFTGPADGINVQAVTDVGKTHEAKYTPTVNPFVIIAVSQESKNIQGVPQEGTPTFTIPEDATNASITSRKLVDPTDNTQKDSVTIEGKGTFVIDETGKVTFTPVPSYTGDVPAIEVKATATVTNEKNETATITQTATYKPEIIPVELGKTPATSTNLQGLEQKGTPTFTGNTVEVNGEQKEVTITPNSYTLVKDGAEVTTTPAYKKGTTEEIGTYTIDPATGEVTLTPTDKTYTGEVEPAVVQATGSNNVKVQTTYTPTITPVTPTTEASTTSDVQGKVQTSPIKLDTEETGDDKGKTVNFDKGTQTGPKGERVELNPETLTLLNEAGAEVESVTTPQGTYALDKANKTISFTPNKDFVGTATPVKVQIKDVNGTKVETTYTPTVIDVTMESVDKTSEAPQGQTQTGKPEFTISSPNVQITGYKLVDPVSKTPVDGTEIEVPEQGTYKIDKTTGQVTFVPKPGYTGTTDGITVQATDENGETKDAKYTPKVTPLTVTPENKTSKNIQGVPQEGTPTFTIPEGVTNASITSRKLVDPSDNTPKDSVTVEGKGTFVIDETGKVTFTPVPSYTGEVPAIEVEATVTVTNEKNEPATITSKATYKPEIVPLELGKTPATSTNLQGLEQKGTPTFTGNTVEVNGEQKEVTITPNSYTLVKDGAEVTTTPAYKKGTTEEIGTYTIDPATGEVTLTPTDKTYTGEVEPAVVQATGSNNVKVQTTYTPTITPVTPTTEASTTSDVQGKVQTSPIKLDTEETGDDKGKTVNFDKGTQTGPKGERVELNPETLTLLNEAGAEVESVTTPQGTYALDKANKTISFTPNKDFVGTATPVKVQIKDVNGTKVETTYTPTVIDVTMESVDKTSEAPQGQTQTGKPEFTISSPNVQITGYKLVDPVSKTPVDGTEIEVPEQGTYKIDKTTGQVTFVPKPGYTGTTDGITVQATDENGETKDAKYTPKVTPLTVTPENKTSKNIQGVPQEGTPTFTIPEGVTNASITSRKLVDPSDNTPKDSVTVEGKGTFVIDETGKVTFTPVPSYTGEVPAIEVEATVTVTNEKNEPATITSKATYKPEIVPVKPTAEASTTSDVQGKVQTSSIVLDTEETGDDKGKTVNFNKGIEQGPKGERTELNPDTLTLLNEAGEEVTSVTTPQGKYELDKANKTITFTPNKDFAGEATPVKVQIKDANGTKVETTYTPTVIEVTPTGKDSATTGPQGIAQTSPIVFNQKDESDNTTVNFETGHDRVELKQDTLTLVNENGEKVTTITVPEVGTYELKDGAITFTPVKTFKGTAEGVTVQVEDENGKIVTKKYVPTVTPVTPEGENAATEGPKAQPQTSTIVFDKKDEDNSTVNFNKGHENVALDPTTTTLVGKDGSPTTEVKVPGEGTYTLVNNVIIFTPEPEFAGKATGVSVQVKDANGTVVTKTYTPTVRPVTTFVDEAGTPITADKSNIPVVHEEDGTKPTKDIYGYKFIRVELDNKGNTKHIYEPAKGESVKVSYVSTTGEVLKDSQTVKPKDTLVGTTYDASTETIKSERIEKDGKVYLLKERKADSASEKGKVSDKEQTITYVYEEVKESEPKRNYGNVVVLYTDKFGRPISGVTETGKEVGSTVLDTPNAPLNTKYDTTDNRPQTITTKDGKVYTLKKVTKNSDAEQSGVKGRTSVVTYVYEILNNTEEFPEAHIGVVLVNYLDEEGNPISGKTPEGQEVPNVVVDTDAALVDTEYDTTDNKPSVIVAENGDVYELVKASETSVEKGKVVEGATIVDYVYRKVVTTFVDEEGKEINPSDKGTKDKKDVPEYIFKETKKDEKGNTIHVYQKVTTTYVDEEGKEINPLDKGTKGNKEIPEYIFKETKKDAKGNTIHVYQKVSTTYVDEEGKEINPSDRGTKANKDISGYTFKETKKDAKGNTIHVYQKVTSSNPSTSTPSIDSVLTTFVDENGNVIIHEENGSHPGREIEGYELIGIKRDSRGNVRNIYRKIPTSTTGLASTSEQSVQSLTEVKKELPNTGTATNASLATLGLLGLLSGFGLVARKKKED